MFLKHPISPLKNVLPILNNAMLAFQKDISKRPELLAGICLSVARFDGSSIEIAQIGDAFAVVENSNGDLTVSPYRSYVHEREVGKLRDRVFKNLASRLYGCKPANISKKEKANIRRIFWEEVVDPWIELRRRNCNDKKSPSGYGLLNGQKTSSDFLWYRKFPAKNIRRVLLCTDGLLTPKVLNSGNALKIGRWLLERFKRGGWPAVLKETRSIDKKSKTINLTDAPEATGYSLTLF